MLTVAEETLQELAVRARQAGGDPPLRPGDQRRDLRHLQGRSAAQGRGRCGGQHRRRPRALDAVERRLPFARVRLHALQSALRQELEERPGAHGRQGRPQGPALPHRARRRPGVLARHPLERRPDALPGQHALQDEAGTRSSAAGSPRSTTAARSSPATPARARATSAAGSSRTTGSRPSSPCRSTCSTTPVSPPTSGC